ncbi:retrovirus-related pol polyprotein from transposon TNT 1-94 [Tanacetum coccineum]|uniref:Retrovirus-related pol polyprotein from transposon TNT 1-94 n=1 Tax=Tanacetum coccineum TaxID=301880 RepID=A0ABQ4WEA5_9ASTR
MGKSSTTNARRQSSFAAGTSGTRANILCIGGNNSGQQRVVKCFNCQGEGHMGRQCPKPKRKRDATWFRDKVLLVEAQGSGKDLNEEELEFLAYPGVVEGPVIETVITYSATYQADDLDVYDSAYVLSEVPHSEITHNDMLNQSVQEMQYSEQTHLVNYPENEITSDSNIIPYSQYLLETQNATVQDINSSAQHDAMVLSMFEQLSNQVTICNKVNKDNPLANESLSAELERYKERKAQQIKPMLYDGSVIAKESNVMSIADFGETLMLEEDNKQCFKIQKKQFLIENDRLLDQIISQDIVNIVVNSYVDMNTSVNVNSTIAMNDSVNYVEMCNKCLELEAELIKQHNMVEKDEYNRLSKSFYKLEQHCISLELAMQLNKEIFQKNNTSVNQTEPLFDHLFELNNLKAKLQAKDTTIKKLKANIKRLNKTSTTNNVKKDIDEIETINIELKFKGKDIVDNAAQVVNDTTIAPGMEIVKQAKPLNPLDSASYSACKYVKLIQELLGYVRDTCLDIHKPSRKLVAVTPINKKKTVMSKNDRIPQISSSTQKNNKVEDHSRIVKSSLNKSNCVVEPSRNANVQHSKLNTNSKLMRPKIPKTNGSNSKPKIAKSVISNKKETGTSRGSNTSVAPSSSSSVDLRLSKLFWGIWTLDAPSI